MSNTVRERLDHPVIDGDGHWLEPGPLFMEYLREVGGPSAEKKFIEFLTNRPHETWYSTSVEERAAKRIRRPGWWQEPTTTLDRATAMLPGLLSERMDELGFDVAIVYPTLGLQLLALADDPLRTAAARALNAMAADLFRPHKDRLLPVAIVPMHTPAEGIAALTHAVQTLGFRAIVIGDIVRRSVQDRSAAPGYWLDTLALDSAYDYDPFWKACIDLKVAVTAHSGGIGWPDRQSPSNFVYSHLGHFAAGNEAFCKSLILGGVMRRFPTLNVAFLEGGAGWAAKLHSDLIGHWRTRNAKALAAYLAPQLLDKTRLRALIEKYGAPRVKNLASEILQLPSAIHPHKSLEELSAQDGSLPDDFAASGIDAPGKVDDIFDRLFFGCEADDISVAWAFRSARNAPLHPIFGSDVGHFDVTQMSGVLHEAYELVEDGLITAEQFRRFTYLNAASLHCRMNPDFFAGTRIANTVRSDLDRLDQSSVKA